MDTMGMPLPAMSHLAPGSGTSFRLSPIHIHICLMKCHSSTSIFTNEFQEGGALKL